MIIHSFNEIKILPNSLIFIDLNKTIISYLPNKSNDSLLKKYIKGTLTKPEYLEIVNTHKPYILDKNNFNKFINKIKKTNSKIYILTSIKEGIKDKINKTVKDAKIPIKKIIYSKNKGVTIKNIKHKYNYNNLLFIDDSLKKIKIVKELNPEAITYRIKHNF
jgi:hypothetical protein